MHNIDDIHEFAQKQKIEIHHHFYANQKNTILEPFRKHELNALLLLSTVQPFELCLLLESDFFEIEKICNEPVYKKYTIAKKRGGKREICAPMPRLKTLQKKLNYYLQAYYLWIKPVEVHGFVVNPHYMGKHCNIRNNAMAHVGKKHVLNIDLKDFFSNITARRIKSLFMSPLFRFNENIATALAFLTTFEGKLPIGSPVSPVISNFVCISLDNDLNNFCRSHHLTYTRYADDLTFSSADTISTDTLLDIINIIQQHHFKINEKKLRLQPAHRKQTVTGLTVNDKVNVDRKMLKNIRAMLHDISTNGIDNATQKHFKTKDSVDNKLREKFICRLMGYINFTGQVRGKNDALYLKLKSKLESFFK